ncbi:S8 family serine peptidase [Streptomyces olivoreticuli]
MDGLLIKFSVGSPGARGDTAAVQKMLDGIKISRVRLRVVESVILDRMLVRTEPDLNTLSSGRVSEAMNQVSKAQGVVSVEPDEHVDPDLEASAPEQTEPASTTGTGTPSRYNPESGKIPSPHEKQWNLEPSTSTAGIRTPHGIDATGAWKLEAGKKPVDGSGATIAIVDSGVTQHADFGDRLLKGYNFITGKDAIRNPKPNEPDGKDYGNYAKKGECGSGQPAKDKNSSWHGTHVAGIAAANGIVQGVAYQAKILPVRVTGKCGADMATVAKGIMWAAGVHEKGVPENLTPADVINVSLGFDIMKKNTCKGIFQEAMLKVEKEKKLVVAAAGNENTPAAWELPASCGNLQGKEDPKNVLTVASSDKKGERSDFSNYNIKGDEPIELTAPGDKIYSTTDKGKQAPEGGSWGEKSGTSMAAPHIAGLAALVIDARGKSGGSKPSPAEIKDTLATGASAIKKCEVSEHKEGKVTVPGTQNGCGKGLPNAKAVVEKAIGSRSPATSPAR